MRVKRLVASVGASFESFVNKVENHEAVADQMIRDIRGTAAKLKVQLGRVNGQIARLEERRDALIADGERWRDRARRFAKANEEQALECLRRMERAKAEQSRVSDQLAGHETLAAKLKDQLGAVETRLDDLQLKRTTLSSRTAHAKAMTSADPHLMSDAEDVFDRWEMAVVQDEYLDSPASCTGDRLERELGTAEETERLSALLDEIKKEG
ncbi:MAG: PspA/IM30 family protein [Pseudomonadota bacterium]